MKGDDLSILQAALDKPDTSQAISGTRRNSDKNSSGRRRSFDVFAQAPEGRTWRLFDIQFSRGETREKYCQTCFTQFHVAALQNCFLANSRFYIS